jgi:CubicO group peptidase (beta-lactamase class C family)
MGAAALAVAASMHGQAHARPLPTAAPETVGLSAERLRRIDTFFAHEIDLNRVSGAVVAIVRRDLVYGALTP